MERRQAFGLAFLVFGASMIANVFGVIIDCSNIVCNPFSGMLTILLTVIAVLSIILGYDHLV